MHIAILGGSFDPPHNGHIAIAHAVKEHLPYIERVLLMPCFSHPFDKQISSPYQRLAMCKLLENEFVQTSDFEINKQGKSYTIDTLAYLSKQNPKHTYYWILGSDQLADFCKWKEYKKLLSCYNFIIFPRAIRPHQLTTYITKTLHLKSVPNNITPLPYRISDTSSTTIRTNIKKEQPITNLIAKKVAAYIRAQYMYKTFLPSIDAPYETKDITVFLARTFKKTGLKNAVIGLSGGVDSAVSFVLLTKVLPAKNIHVAHLHCQNSDYKTISEMLEAKRIPQKNRHIISIEKIKNDIARIQSIASSSKVTRFEATALNASEKRGNEQEQQILNRIRIGNIAARVRMIILFDLAKKYNGLVCGTENKSEHLLGYFTRYGDQASDIEPITYLYKTHIYELARFLNVPDKILNATPSANLWAGQTDENEFGFTYEEVDQVLYLYFEKKRKISEILRLGFKNTKKIIERYEKNSFKNKVPYSAKTSK